MKNTQNNSTITYKNVILDKFSSHEYSKNTPSDRRNQKNHVDFSVVNKFLAIQKFFLDSLFLNLTLNFDNLKFI